MDALTASPHHAPVRVVAHIKRLDDCFGDFLLRVVCDAALLMRGGAALPKRC